MSLGIFDPVDSGEIPPTHQVLRFADAVVDTARLETTRDMREYIALRPISPLARYATDAHATIEIPQTIGIYDPGRPAWNALPAEYPRVRPEDYRARHRRKAPVWARRALLVGLGSVGTVVLELAGLFTLAVTR